MSAFFASVAAFPSMKSAHVTCEVRHSRKRSPTFITLERLLASVKTEVDFELGGSVELF